MGSGHQSVMVMKQKQNDAAKQQTSTFVSCDQGAGELYFSITTRENSLMEGCLEENTLVLDTDLVTGRVYF